MPLWAAAVGAAAVAALASALVVFFATRDSTPQSQTGTTPGQTGTGAAPAAREGLAAVIPPRLFQDCRVDPAPKPGATESATCVPVGGGDHPDEWQVSMYPNEKALTKAYNDAFADARARQPLIERNSPIPHGLTSACVQRGWGKEGSWLHGVGDPPAGRVFCYFAGGTAYIGWTHLKRKGNKLQDTHVDVLGIASIDSSDHRDMGNWWGVFHHEIGKQFE